MHSKTEKDLLVKLGGNIRKRRLALKLTQAQLAFELSTDGRHIRRIENGEINVGFLTLNKIAEIFEIDLEELLP